MKFAINNHPAVHFFTWRYRTPMPMHKETRQMPYSAQQMFDLVADVKSYPEFLPWCAAARITRHDYLYLSEVIDADLVISFKVFREKFASQVILYPATHKIDVSYINGPFRFLNSTWHFCELDNGGCAVDFFVDFEFKSKLLQTAIGLMFDHAMQRIVRAFEVRAQHLFD